MPSNLSLTDDQIKNFNETRCLKKDLILAVILIKNALEREEEGSLTVEEEVSLTVEEDVSVTIEEDVCLTVDQHAVFQVVVEALDNIDKLLDDLEEIILNQENDNLIYDTPENSAYTIECSSNMTLESIRITRNNDTFYWTICKPKAVSGCKYFHHNTNGTLADIVTAFEQTKYLIYSAEHTKELSYDDADDAVSPRRRKARCSIF